MGVPTARSTYSRDNYRPQMFDVQVHRLQYQLLAPPAFLGVATSARGASRTSSRRLAAGSRHRPSRSPSRCGFLSSADAASAPLICRLQVIWWQINLNSHERRIHSCSLLHCAICLSA